MDIYGFEAYEGFISDVTDRLLPQIEEWQNRPLSEVYPVVFIDAIHYSVRNSNAIRKLAAYIILGINCDLLEKAHFPLDKTISAEAKSFCCIKG